MVITNKATNRLFEFTNHSECRWRERTGKGWQDMIPAFERALPYGAQRGKGLLLLDDSTKIIFATEDKKVLTVLTFEQALVNMQNQGMFGKLEETSGFGTLLSIIKPGMTPPIEPFSDADKPEIHQLIDKLMELDPETITEEDYTALNKEVDKKMKVVNFFKEKGYEPAKRFNKILLSFREVFRAKKGLNKTRQNWLNARNEDVTI
jgi:hypothetical protein